MPGARQAPSAWRPSRMTAEGGGSQDHYRKPQPPLQCSSAAAGTISQALYTQPEDPRLPAPFLHRHPRRSAPALHSPGGPRAPSPLASRSNSILVQQGPKRTQTRPARNPILPSQKVVLTPTRQNTGFPWRSPTSHPLSRAHALNPTPPPPRPLPRPVASLACAVGIAST